MIKVFTRLTKELKKQEFEFLEIEKILNCKEFCFSVLQKIQDGG
jgi:hypothetical protein